MQSAWRLLAHSGCLDPQHFMMIIIRFYWIYIYIYNIVLFHTIEPENHSLAIHQAVFFGRFSTSVQFSNLLRVMSRNDGNFEPMSRLAGLIWFNKCNKNSDVMLLKYMLLYAFMQYVSKIDWLWPPAKSPCFCCFNPHVCSVQPPVDSNQLLIYWRLSWPTYSQIILSNTVCNPLTGFILSTCTKKSC